MTMRPDNLSAFPGFRRGEVSTTSPAELGITRIAGTAVWAVNVWADLGAGDLLFIGEDLLFNRLLELNYLPAAAAPQPLQNFCGPGFRVSQLGQTHSSST